ncbi:MAG: galactose-1-phosphate uridylyltransferase [archaeon]|nr:MAG: galactose-1-phosphate uridylyltransferase [archaeon]
MKNEIRKDYISEKYVIFSPKRAKRPKDFKGKEEKTMTPENCPFCPGNEHMTPPALIQIPKKKWKIRLIPNKFPALSGIKFKGEEGGSFFRHYKPYGYHEILIETPDHGKEYHELSLEQLELCLRIIIDRYKKLRKKKEIAYVTVFKNKGKMAGASLDHTHSQIIATPVFPRKISQKMEAAEKYYQKEDRCPYCDIIRAEKNKKVRIISENREFLVLAPYASTWPYESWVFPKKHVSELYELDKRQRKYLAITLKKLIGKYAELFGNFPYHIVYNSFPESDFWHFHLEVFPKLKIYGGFEYYGVYVNELLPEYAARNLRFR